MKNIIIAILFLINLSIFADDMKLTGNELIQRSIDVSTPDTMESLSKQIVHFYTGKSREFQIRSYTKDGNDKMFFVYLKPARVKGDKFLFFKGGEIWVYFSKTGRKRRIASSARKSKMQGSDFSYEDISMMSSMREDFNSKIIREEKFEGEDCYVVESLPKKNESISYNKLLSWIDKKIKVLRKIEYYRKNELEKEMVQEDFKKMGDYYIPYSSVMKSTKNDTKTEIFTEELKINIEIPDSRFNKNALSR
ncbi:MAG: outer membrane lipoprotein-sorting protein [Spirochaetes bacterium]|nr:outer membrane lipoprotein-sorting protein [Spirochaetota bacterium]